ncbi:MAG: ribonuclease HII [Eubacteriales bacterium]|nr:ribonuclease HII [Eubacteriales bacterium]
METIQEIKRRFQEASQKDRSALYEKYAQDGRAGVQKLLERERRREELLEKELCRMEKMKEYERKYEHLGYVCGIDEVGRGPLAGPVVACAVILPKDCTLLLLDDSKKLTARKREELHDRILSEAVSVGLGSVSPARIDEINILQATYEAMREAVGRLSVIPQILLNDAVTIPGISIPQVPIIKGDAKSASIAAASIVAKVTRDRMMEEYDKILPEYGFASNKGYGSEAHIRAIREHGPSPIHRQSFLKNIL